MDKIYCLVLRKYLILHQYYVHADLTYAGAQAITKAAGEALMYADPAAFCVLYFIIYFMQLVFEFAFELKAF
jgi:hypothetical protein